MPIVCKWCGVAKIDLDKKSGDWIQRSGDVHDCPHAPWKKKKKS